MLKQVVSAFMPVVARIWWRGFLEVEEWPMRLLAVLFADDVEEQARLRRDFAPQRP